MPYLFSKTSFWFSGSCSPNPCLSLDGLNSSKCNVSMSSKTSPIRTPVTENDPLGALQPGSEANGTDDVAEVVEKISISSSDVIGDCETSSKMKYDLLISGMFSHNPSKNEKKDGEMLINNKGKRKEETMRGAGDGSDTGVRVPKSATFHNGREKEVKARTARGSTPLIEVNLYLSFKF